MQGWVLRRCLSNINRICGREYRPREPKIRELCAIAGVTWPEPKPRSSRSSLEPHSDSDFEEEEMETEGEFSDDEEIPGFSILISKFFKGSGKNLFLWMFPCIFGLVGGMSLCQVKVKSLDMMNLQPQSGSILRSLMSLLLPLLQPLQEKAVVPQCLSPLPSVTPEPKGPGCEEWSSFWGSNLVYFLYYVEWVYS